MTILGNVAEVLGWGVFGIGLLAGLICIPLGLGGTFIILADALILALVTRFDAIGVWPLVIMAALAVVGEVIESFLGIFTVKKFGASRWAMLGTFIGGIAGAMAGTPILPIIGSLIGAFIGAFAGAFAAEVLYRRQVEPSLRAGWGAFLGRVLAAVIKFQIGIIMVGIIWYELAGYFGGSE